MKKSTLIIKIIIAVFVIAMFTVLVINLFPLMRGLATTEGQLEFKNQIDEMGIKGLLILFGLNLAQILLVILPGEPLEILAGMCYGAWGGLMFMFASVFITNVLIYMLTGKLGKEFIYSFFKKDKIDKIENSKLFKDPKKIEWLMIFLFLIPGTPKDLLTYIGVLLPIKPSRFILIATVARFPSIISSTLAGDIISSGHWYLSIIIYIVTFVITGIAIFIANKHNKKDTDEVRQVLS